MCNCIVWDNVQTVYELQPNAQSQTQTRTQKVTLTHNTSPDSRAIRAQHLVNHVRPVNSKKIIINIYIYKIYIRYIYLVDAFCLFLSLLCVYVCVHIHVISIYSRL